MLKVQALNRPVVFLVLFALLQAALLLLFCALNSKTLSVAFAMDQPMDFIDFFQATQTWVAGTNPYLAERFVTPPFSLLVFRPFVGLSPLTVFYGFFFVNLFSLFLGWYLLIKKYSSQMSWGQAFLLLSLSYPSLFLLQRGNLDALVFLGVCVFLSGSKEFIRILGLVLAIQLKLYPAFLLLPLILQRRFREFWGVLALVLATTLPFGSLNTEFLHILKRRGTAYSPLENLSLTGFFKGVSDFATAPFGYSAPNNFIFPLLAWCTFFILLILLVRNALKKPEGAEIRSLPFLMLIPAQVFPYVGLFGMAFVLNLERRSPSVFRNLGTVGVACLLFHATGWNILTGSDQWHFVSPIGSLLLAISAALDTD